MVTNELLTFVQEAKKKGATQEQVVALLASSGWSETDVTEALSKAWEEKQPTSSGSNHKKFYTIFLRACIVLIVVAFGVLSYLFFKQNEKNQTTVSSNAPVIVPVQLQTKPVTTVSWKPYKGRNTNYLLNVPPTWTVTEATLGAKIENTNFPLAYVVDPPIADTEKKDTLFTVFISQPVPIKVQINTKNISEIEQYVDYDNEKLASQVLSKRDDTTQQLIKIEEVASCDCFKYHAYLEDRKNLAITYIVTTFPRKESGFLAAVKTIVSNITFQDDPVLLVPVDGIEGDPSEQ